MTNEKRVELIRIKTKPWFVALMAVLAMSGHVSAPAQMMDQQQHSSPGQLDSRGAIIIRGHEYPAARFSSNRPGAGTLLRPRGGGGGSAPGASGLRGLIQQAQQADVRGDAGKASSLYWQAACTYVKSGGAGLGVSEMNLLSCSAGQAIVGVEKAQRAGNDAQAMAIMKESEPVFRRLARLDWNNPEWPYRLGVVLVNVGKRYPEARRSFSQALTIAGGSELYRKKAKKKLEQLDHAEQGFGMSNTQLRRW